MVRDAPPVRTCVGCRSRAPSSELLRVVADELVAVWHDAEPPGRDGVVVRVVPDPARRREGRGAHIHPNPDCLALAARRRAFGRALRVTGVVDTRPLAQYLDNLAAPEDNGEPTVGGTPHPDQQGRTTDMRTR